MKAEKNTVSTYPENAPDLGYKPVPDIFKLPQGMNFGPCSSVAAKVEARISAESIGPRDEDVMRFSSLTRTLTA